MPTPPDPLRVLLLPGDGIGPEVVEAARLAVDATGLPVEWARHDIGDAARRRAGTGLPPGAVEAARAADAVVKGPVTTVPGRRGEPSVNVGLRRALGVPLQVRPSRTRDGLTTVAGAADLVVVRDTSEDLYAGIELAAGSAEAAAMATLLAGWGMPVRDGAALGVKPVSEPVCRRLVAFAVDYARSVGQGRLTVVHKATAMRRTDGLFLEVAREELAGVSDLEWDDRQVDALCAELVRRPERFGVLVTLNLYGDVLSDLAAGLTGGLGLAAGANFGDGVAVFEAAHGSAPKLAGTGRANPMAMILSAALLLRHVGAAPEADRLERAVDAVLAAGRTLTYDVARPGVPPASTAEVAEAVAAAVRDGSVPP